MVLTYKQMIANALDNMIETQIKKLQQDVKIVAEKAMEALYPPEKIKQRLSIEIDQLIGETAKALVGKVLGVEFSSWEDKPRFGDHGFNSLCGLLAPEIREKFIQTDVASMMARIMTKELEKYTKSADFKKRAREAASNAVYELVQEVLDEAAKGKVEK